MKYLGFFLLAFFLWSHHLPAQQAWVDRPVLCQPSVLPSGETQPCGFPTQFFLIGTGFGHPYWMMNSGGLYYWTAVDLLKSPTGDHCDVRDMAEAPDHTVWATSPSTGTVCQAQTTSPAGATIKAFPLSFGSAPDSIALGRDGSLWVTDNGRDVLVHLDSSGSVVSEFPLCSGCDANGIATAPDGSLWIALHKTASLAHFDPVSGTVLSTISLPSATHPYKVTISPSGQICYLGSGPDYLGCLGKNDTILAENALPGGPRDANARGQMIIGPDNFVWFSDPQLDTVRVDEQGSIIPYSVGIAGAGLASRSDGISFVFNNSDGTAGVGTLRAAFVNLTASPGFVTEGTIFTLSGILTLFVADPAPTITLPYADPTEPFTLGPGMDLNFSKDFILEAAASTGTIEAIYTNGSHSASGSAPLQQINLPPSFKEVAVTSRVVVGVETTIISGSVSDPGTKDSFGVLVDFGDGWPPAFAQTASSFTASHTYSNPGTYTLRYTATDLAQSSVSGSATVTAGPADFSLSSSPTQFSVAPGEIASYVITVTPSPGPFNQTVSFACETLPPLSACLFSPTSLVPGVTTSRVTLNVGTTAPTRVSQARWPAGLAACLAVICVMRPRRRIGRLSMVLLAASLVSSCGGNSVRTEPQQRPGTPAGTYTITVTGTSNSIQHSTTVNLTVQ